MSNFHTSLYPWTLSIDKVLQDGFYASTASPGYQVSKVEDDEGGFILITHHHISVIAKAKPVPELDAWNVELWQAPPSEDKELQNLALQVLTTEPPEKEILLKQGQNRLAVTSLAGVDVQIRTAMNELYYRRKYSDLHALFPSLEIHFFEAGYLLGTWEGYPYTVVVDVPNYVHIEIWSEADTTSPLWSSSTSIEATQFLYGNVGEQALITMFEELATKLTPTPFTYLFPRIEENKPIEEWGHWTATGNTVQEAYASAVRLIMLTSNNEVEDRISSTPENTDNRCYPIIPPSFLTYEKSRHLNQDDGTIRPNNGVTELD